MKTVLAACILAMFAATASAQAPNKASVVAEALRLLGTGPDERITIVSRQDVKALGLTDPTAVGWAPRAWAVRAEGQPERIYLPDWTKENAKAIAGIIAHEQFHLDVTMAEGPAYQRQLEVLRAVRASALEIMRVEWSKEQQIASRDYRVLRSRALKLRAVNLLPTSAPVDEPVRIDTR